MVNSKASLFVVALLLVSPGTLCLQATLGGVHGLEKVIGMLKKMSAEALDQKNLEKVEFAKSSTACDTDIQSMKKEVDKAGEQISLVSGEIEAKGSEAKTLGEDVESIAKKLDTDAAELKLKSESRAKDHAAFVEESRELMETVDQLTRAHLVLKDSARDRPGGTVVDGGAALDQLNATGVLSPQVRAALLALMNGNATGSTYQIDVDFVQRMSGPGDADAYKASSSGIIQVLEQLRNQAKESLKDVQKKEVNAQHSEELIIQSLKTSVNNAMRTKAEKLEMKLRREEQVAYNKKQLISMKEGKAESVKMLDAMQTECKDASSEFEANQKTREGEIEALAQATQLLESSEVAKAKKHLNFAQVTVSRGTSLVQVSGSGAADAESRTHHRVRVYLEAEAKRLKSASLALLAEQMEKNPFAKVNTMIKDMISRLEADSNADQSKQEFCDTEVAKNKQSRTELTEDVDSLAAKVQEGESTIIRLREEIETLTDEIDEIGKAREESKRLRKTESNENAAIIEESTTGEEAVADAIVVLKGFYKDAVAAVLLQQTAADPYTGLQAEAGGVLAMLEVVEADFAKAAANAQKAEDAAIKDHDAFMSQSEKTQAAKKTRKEACEEDKATAVSELQSSKAELKTAKTELKAAKEYAVKLDGQCVDKGTSFKERAAARQAEIQSLKEALKIL